MGSPKTNQLGNQVKHLLIILISILLLSSFLTSCDKKEETLYRWGEYPEIVWIGDKETQPKYQGQVKDGKPDGLGVLIYPDGGRYVGSWKNGGRNGRGILSDNNGYKWVGDWKDNKRWNGTEYDKDGNIIYRWVNGKRKYHN